MMKVICLVGKSWASLSYEQKVPFIQKSEVDRVRFQEESECYIR
jgi:hypothetical protein